MGRISFNVTNELTRFNGFFHTRFMFGFLYLLAILQTQQIDLDGKKLIVEIADTYEAVSKGLMGRKSLSDGEGMLFVYEKPIVLSFWMKDTLIPLSIGFFDETKKLIEIIDMPVPPPGAKEYPLFNSSRPSRYALEVPVSWFRQNNIRPGMKFSFLDRVDPVE